MADPCLENTNTVHLSTNTSGDLLADVQLEPLNEGSLEADANGIGVTLNGSGGIQHTSAGMGLKVGQGLHVGAEGLMKVNGYAYTASPGSTPNANLNRGSNVQYGNTLTLTGSLASNEVASYIVAHARWRGIWVTNLTAFGGQIQDRVDAYLQVQVDGGGWLTVDQAALTRANCGGSFHLDKWYAFPAANGTVHTFQARLLVGGGTVTGSNPQGLLENEYGGTLEWFY